MAAQPNYYEVLDVARNARTADIAGAYNHWLAQFGKDTTPPDPVRESLLREARDVLSDPARRAAYDAQLAAQPASARKQASRKGARGPALAIGVTAAVAAAVAAAFFTLRPGGGHAPASRARSAAEIQQAMAGSVSALVTYDISGKSTPAGLAWVLEDKLLVANCQRLPPGVQLMVNTGTKEIPARVTLADEAIGLCKILTDSYVGEPLAVNAALPSVGAKVYAAALGAKGEVGMREATVTGVVDAPPGKAIQASPAGPPGGGGAPLLDAQGKVVAVATLQPDGNVIHRVIPAGWLAENRPRAEEPRPYQGSGAGSSAGTAGAAGAAPGTGYAPPLLSNDYGCECDMENDPEMKARREERWKKISEMPAGEREKAERLERQSEEATRKLMKDMNDRIRK